MAISRKKLIEDNVSEVDKILRVWLIKNPKFQAFEDDLRSHGYMKLIETADRFLKSKRIKNFKAYLRLTVYRGFWDVIRDNNRFIRPTSKTGRNYEEILHGPKLLLGFAERYGASDDYHPTEAIEALAEACLDEIDSLIVSMLKVRRVTDRRAKGLDQYQLEQLELKPIAKELGLEPLEVQERAGQILNRFRRIYYESDPKHI